MKYFVTGASGFLGQALCRALAERGDDVIALCRTPESVRFENPHIQKAKGDVCDFASLKKAMHDCDSCFHLAALAKQWHPREARFHEVNVMGTKNILNAMKACEVKRLVFTSTAGVFASSKDRVLSETDFDANDAHTLLSHYERSKAQAQALVLQEPALECVIVHPSRVYGPGPLNASNTLTKMLVRAQRQRVCFLPGKGEALANYVFVDDVVQGHLLAMQKGRKGESYILGGENLNYRELFSAFANAHKRNLSLVGIPLFLLRAFARVEEMKAKRFGIEPLLLPEFVEKYSSAAPLSSDKAACELGYEITPIKEALRLTLEGLAFS